MQIVAMLAVLGAALGQPDEPAEQDAPPAEQPDAGTESYPAEPAEQQQADADSAATQAQPAETGSEEASAEFDSTTGWRGGAGSWHTWMRRAFSVLAGRTYGPFTVTMIGPRQPTITVYGTVQGSRSPEQWTLLEQQLSAWLCAEDGGEIVRLGGNIVLDMSDEAGTRRTVRITECEASARPGN